MGPVNFMARPDRTYLGQIFTLDFEDESVEQFGAASMFDLEKTQVLDGFACIMCNRCQEVCPATNAGTALSPAALEINKRYVIKTEAETLAAGGSSAATLFESALPAAAAALGAESAPGSAASACAAAPRASDGRRCRGALGKVHDAVAAGAERKSYPDNVPQRWLRRPTPLRSHLFVSRSRGY